MVFCIFLSACKNDRQQALSAPVGVQLPEAGEEKTQKKHTGDAHGIYQQNMIPIHGFIADTLVNEKGNKIVRGEGDNLAQGRGDALQAVLMVKSDKLQDKGDAYERCTGQKRSAGNQIVGEGSLPPEQGRKSIGDACGIVGIDKRQREVCQRNDAREKTLLMFDHKRCGSITDTALSDKAKFFLLER